ncbi:SET and MYND domain-containing protein 4-like [Danaus plexippus]|uniref:SET and MYND domain-containing protein 4-like n=1 Tax=Danaus plexippus TaxID=13037 RepID=UPI002AB00A0D|nr:SET and MYND domain-containing protein 4-like [Danaus plexippus]
MNSVNLPEDCARQWEILLLLLSSEEKKIDRTHESEIDTMSYFYNNKGVRKILLYWLQQMKDTYARKTCDTDTALKCDGVSLCWRQKGNEKFRANLVEESYKCYTNSVLYAKPNSLMYTLALANRSAALLRLKRFQECLSDVSLAIDSGYPAEQRHKLLLRRADCYIELQSKEARTALNSAIQYAGTLNMTVANKLEFERHIKILEKKLECVKRDVVKEEEVLLPDCYLGPNPDFVSASKSIELRYKESRGRHVVAVEPAGRGDVLFSEEPYAWVALPSDDAICEMCCDTDINPVPCSVCSRSVYCGCECASRAISFHRWECVGAQCSLFPTIGIAHLALRVLLISTNNGFPPSPVSLPQPCTAGELFRSYGLVDNIQIYKTGTDPFYRMFNLVTNFNKMDNTDYIQYALTATMLTLYLENFTSFFDYLPSKMPCSMSESQLKLFAAAVILRSMGQLVCNGHATLSLAVVEEDDGRNGKTITEKEVRRATAIYPSAAMMNHSCDPNIINTFYKSRLIVRCQRELPAGGEVFNCYGPHRARAPAAARRKALKAQYMFTCHCADCNDTERKDFVSLFSAYLCQSCKGPVWAHGVRPLCTQCRSALHLERAHTLLDRADDLAIQAEQVVSLEERCEKMAASYRLKQQVWHRHHASLRMAADRLARLYADTGDFGKSMELIKQNIQSLEYRFGSFSVEVAHELRKLSDVMLERILNSPQHLEYREWCLEAHKVVKKAIQLMELNYGSWEPLVSRLKQHECYLAATLAESRTPEAVDCVHHNLHYNLKI